MKRKSGADSSLAKAKRPRVAVPDYCDVELRKDERGSVVWPAPEDAMDRAREFIRECAAARKKTLIVPDKDADGLDSGVIIHRTLTTLGLPRELIEVHLLTKGKTVHDASERALMDAREPGYVIVLDQGSVGGGPIVTSPAAKTLLIDHHLSDEFPEAALVVSACHYPPVATSSLLTYEICRELHADIEPLCAYLCAIGTHGDLGTTLKWKFPFPDMAETFKLHSKKAINDAVALLNAPRRTARFDVASAWDALLAASGPKDVLTNRRLMEAREEINLEVERCTHVPPKFSKDGKIAVLKINSAAQVHPVIATRWAGYLNSKALEIVMVANYGYLPGMVNFSCRIARSAKSRDPPVNIIASLKEAADLSTTDLVSRMGSSFARGHKEASGGIVPTDTFEELMDLLKIGEKPDPVPGADTPKKTKNVGPPQKNNLMGWLAKT